MNECNSNEIHKTNFTDQTKFRLNEITEIGNYFMEEISQRKLCIKKLICYYLWLHRQGFNCFRYNKWRNMYYFSYKCCWSSCRNSKCKFDFNFFSLTTGIFKKLLSITRNKKKKHYKIIMLAKSKLNSIETLVFQALIDMEISHE